MADERVEALRAAPNDPIRRVVRPKRGPGDDDERRFRDELARQRQKAKDGEESEEGDEARAAHAHAHDPEPEHEDLPPDPDERRVVGPVGRHVDTRA